MIKLTAFLGNSGKAYEKTRHNAGFLLSDYLYRGASYESKFHSRYLETGREKILKPMTMMNLSGTALSEARSFFKLKAEEILVVHDDLELPLGDARIEKGGGMRGHNGIRDIASRLGTGDFWRLRIGIGRPQHGDVRLFVTSPFTKDEMITLTSLFSLIEKDWPLEEKERVWKL